MTVSSVLQLVGPLILKHQVQRMSLASSSSSPAGPNVLTWYGSSTKIMKYLQVFSMVTMFEHFKLIDWLFNWDSLVCVCKYLHSEKPWIVLELQVKLIRHSSEQQAVVIEKYTLTFIHVSSRMDVSGICICDWNLGRCDIWWRERRDGTTSQTGRC